MTRLICYLFFFQSKIKMYKKKKNPSFSKVIVSSLILIIVYTSNKLLHKYQDQNIIINEREKIEKIMLNRFE